MGNESRLLGVSWRGWIAAAITMVYGFCTVSEVLKSNAVPDHLVQIVLLVIGFYFGQRKPTEETQ